MSILETNDHLLVQICEYQPEPIAWFKPIYNNDLQNDIVDFEVQYANRACWKSKKVTREELIRKRILQDGFPDPTIKQKTFEQCLSVVTTGNPLEFTYFSTYYEKYFSLSRVKINGGVLSTLRDITDLYLANQQKEENEKQILQQRQLLQQIIDNIPSGLLLFEPIITNEGKMVDMKVKLTNQTAIKVTGSAEEEILKTTYKDFSRFSQPNDYFDLALETLKTGVTTEVEQPGPDGRWYLVNFIKVGNEFLVKFKDITKKKQTEIKLSEKNNLLEAVFNASMMGISIIKAVRNEAGELIDFIYEDINEQALRGRNKQEVLDSLYLSVYPEAKEIGVWDKITYVMETGGPLRYHQQYKNEMWDLWFDVSLIRLAGDRLLVSTNDITNIKRLQQQLMNTIDDLKQSNQRLSDFAHVTSHDMKEPLRKVITNCDLIKEEYFNDLSDPIKARIDKIELSAKRMTNLIDDLLTYSELGKADNDITSIDLNELISETINDIEGLKESDITLRVDRFPSIKGYPTQLGQAFQNLLSNSVKFKSTISTPCIDITYSKEKYKHGNTEDDEVIYHCITFSDNGIGFEPTDVEKIFQLFKRLHSRDDYEGTGIGLSIVQRVMENHKGFVEAHGELNKGATFKLYFPVENSL